MKTLPLVFLAAFAVTYAPLCVLYDHYNARWERYLIKEFDSIQAQIEVRFKLYTRNAVALSKMAEQYWQQPVVTPQEFASIGETVLSIQPEAIGANLLNPEGKIIQVYPPRRNSIVLGKVSQNKGFLKAAELAGLDIWLSAPIPLFQGEPGFVYYFALKRGKFFKGWYGIVISERRFLEQFVANEQFQNYHVSLRDSDSGENYLQTGSLPRDMKYVRTNTFEALNRRFTLQSWPKDASIFSTGLPLVTFVAIVISIFITLSVHFFILRRQAQRHQQQLNALLDHVIQDTTDSVATVKSHLVLMKEDPRLVPMDRMFMHVGFVVELMDQIKVMRGLAELQGKWSQDRQQVLPLVLEALDILTDRLRVHGLIVDYDPEELAPLQANLNQRLFVHATLANILGIFLRLAPDGSTITISSLREDNFLRLRMSSDAALRKMERSDELSLNIAQKVMECQGGSVERISSQPLTVDVVLPA